MIQESMTVTFPAESTRSRAEQVIHVNSQQAGMIYAYLRPDDAISGL